MPRKPKSDHRETIPEERAIVWAHYVDGDSYSKDQGQVAAPKDSRGYPRVLRWPKGSRARVIFVCDVAVSCLSHAIPALRSVQLYI